MEDVYLKKRALCNAIERKCGFRVHNAADYARLSNLIYEDTSQSISETTLKRLFGYIEGWQNPRPSIWNILCRYAGYANEEEFLREACINPELISGEVLHSRVLSSSLDVGTRMQILWYPNHSVTVEYLGNSEFKILDASGTSLKPGGFFKTHAFVEGDTLVLADYYPSEKFRRDANPGILYEIGREGGIKIIFLKESF